MERGNGDGSGAGGVSTVTDGGATGGGATAGGTGTSAGPGTGTGTGGAGTLVNPAPAGGGGGGGGRNATQPRPSGSITNPDGSRTEVSTDEDGNRVINRFDPDGNHTGGTMIHGDEWGTEGMTEEFGPGQEPVPFSGDSDWNTGDTATSTEELPGGRTRTVEASEGGHVRETVTNPDGSSTSQTTHDGQQSSRTTRGADGSEVYEGLDSDGSVMERITSDASGNTTGYEVADFDGELQSILD